MSIRNLDRLFNPASVAVIGASAEPLSTGFTAVRNLTHGGFKGRIMLVGDGRGPISGLDVHSDIAALPEPPDLAVIATPPETVPDVVASLGARGTRAAVILSAALAERGAAGSDLKSRVLAAARPHLLRIVGPNTIGIMVPEWGLDASIAPSAPIRGDLAFVSQSGALVTAVLDWAKARGIGFSHVVALGDMADVDFGDMLDFLAIDDATRAILLYVEGVTKARKFMSAARAAARAKPVLAVKVGRFTESAQAARSHTGALAGADAVYDAAFRRAGMLRVFTMVELFDAVETLAQTGAQNGDALAILTNGGGAGVLATDALLAAGGKLASLSAATLGRLDAALPANWSRGNPVDIIGDANGARYVRALDILLEDGGVDAVLILNCPSALASQVDAARAIATLLEAKAQAHAGRNVLTAWLGDGAAADARRLFAAARIATYDTPDRAVTGFMHRVHYRRNRELLMETPPTRPEGKTPDAGRANTIIARALAAERTWLDPVEVAAVLEAYGIAMPRFRLGDDPNAAVAAATALGGPVALKIRSPDIAHKSDVGGIALNLGNGERVRREAEAMLARVSAAAPTARLEGFVVQRMAERPGAVALMLGMVEDAVFGPVVLFGQGGALAEILGDWTLELPPLNAALARAQMARTRVFRLLQGYRGAAPANLDAVTGALLAVAQLAAEQPALKELDINPLLADRDGVIALDARIRVGRAAGPATARLAIRPYPKELESRERLRDGTALLLRPIRPEDEPLIQDIVGHMDPAALRLRFFMPVRVPLAHAFAARLSQLDYDREMGLIALKETDGMPLGAARFAADADLARAEFAIGLRSDWHGRGLGTLLMRRLIAIAAARGIGELFGDILHENQLMLQLCRALGFAFAAHPDDPAVVRATLKLG